MADPEGAPGPSAAEPQPPAASGAQPTGQPQGPSPPPSPASGQPAPVEETFFDPASLDEALLPAYKQMQRAFTKKTQAIKSGRDKIEAYDAFMRDPKATIQQLAAQYGLNTGQPQRAEPQANGFDPNWQPNSWQEVFSKVEELVAPKLRSQWEREIAPLMGEFRNIKRTQIERTLDEHVPEWRQYEDEMATLLSSHPSLVNDPNLLARLAIPSEVSEGRAMQKALSKLQQKGEAAQVSAGSTTSRQQSASPKGPMSFQDAVEFAKKKLAEEGIRGP